MAECELKWQNCQKALRARGPSAPGGLSGLEALWARRPFGPGGLFGLEAFEAWGPFRPGGPLSLGALQAWGPFFLLFDFLRMTFFFENSYQPNQLPYNIFF